MQSDADCHEWSSVPDVVPEEWLVRYGSTTPGDAQPERAITPQRRATVADSHVDTRLVGLAFVMCIVIFIVAIVGMVLPAQGVRGLVAATGLLATEGAGSVLMARLMIDGRACPRRPARDVDIVSPHRWQR